MGVFKEIQENYSLEGMVQTIRDHARYSYSRRAIVSGNVIELYNYELPVFKGDVNEHLGRANASCTSEDVKAENRAKTAHRARCHVRRVANANPELDKFLTLTFKENVTDLDFANNERDKFFKRLRRVFKSLAFICVTEFQKRGAIHFHLLCNLPFVDVNALAHLWGHGFVKLNRIDNIDNVGAYVTKYMTKDSIDERLIGRKCYTMSRGLNQPVEMTNEKEITELLEGMADVVSVYNSEFESEHYGVVSYTQITLKRKKAESPEVRLRSEGRKYGSDCPSAGVKGVTPLIGRN